MTKATEVKDNPLVSIITPVKDGARYLDECIQSVLNQGYPNIEHIFIDGGSTDGTVEMLSSYQARYPGRVRFISEPDKSGDEGWNKGLKMAKGEIFEWLGADDLSEPGAIQAVVSFFRDNLGAYFVYGNCIVIDEAGNAIGREKIEDFDLEVLIRDYCMVSSTSSFYRREVFEKIGWFDDWGLHLGMDTELFIRIGKEFEMHRIDDVLSRTRYRRESQTGAKESHKRYLREDCKISRRYGGGILSGYCRRYYQFVIIEGLRPMLGFAYPVVKKVLGKAGSRQRKNEERIAN